MSNYMPKDAFGRDFPLEHALSCVGGGWEELITECYNLCIEYSVDIHQVKEKFGGLRFYVGGVSTDKADEFYNKLDAICNRADSTCENCGKPGELDTDRGWYKTLCPDCTQVERGPSRELEHLLSPEAHKNWLADIKSGKVRRTMLEFVSSLKKATESEE